MTRCAGCNRELEVGDRYIEDAPSAFMKVEDTETDDLLASILGGSGGKITYCEDCTQPGGDHFLATFYGDEIEEDV